MTEIRDELDEVLPKYKQIAGILKDQIVRGDLAPGAEVPSERQLSVKYNVARPTASKALEALRREGLVESRQGSGTFVREPHAAPRARERLDRAAALGSMYSESEEVRFPFVGVVDGPPHVTEALGLAAGDPVIQRARVISNANGPVEVSTSWFPAHLGEIAPRLLLAERVGHGTLGYLHRAAGITPTYARDQVSARAGSDEECRMLGLEIGSPVLVYWLVATDAQDTVVEFDEAVYPPQRWAFRQEFPIVF